MDADVGLLQEARHVPDGVRIGPRGLCEEWEAPLYDRWPVVVQLSDRVEVEWFQRVLPISETRPDEMAVSGIGTIAAARVTPYDGASFLVVSMYARWIKPHISTGSRWRVGYADGSAHRIMSDLSAFIGDRDPRTHRILAAGDLNHIHGLTGASSLALPGRDETVFDRMKALGLEFMGPQLPNGRKAATRLEGLPADSRNVPTYYTTRQRGPAHADRQMDYVFASRGFHQSVRTRALNGLEEWGASDHCRLRIEVG